MSAQAERRLEALNWERDPAGRWWKRDGDYELAVEPRSAYVWAWRVYHRGELVADGDHVNDLSAAQAAALAKIGHRQGRRPPGVRLRRCRRCGRPGAAQAGLCRNCYRAG